MLKGKPWRRAAFALIGLAGGTLNPAVANDETVRLATMFNLYRLISTVCGLQKTPKFDRIDQMMVRAQPSDYQRGRTEAEALEAESIKGQNLATGKYCALQKEIFNQYTKSIEEMADAVK
jgi:hypothetical protein